jgi:succinate-semialdehyde dehydrogenase/glutarate-semialdehyde dehydrogenase
MKISSLIRDRNLLHKIFPYGVDEFITINPVNNKFIKKYSYDTPDQLEQKLINSESYFRHWNEKGLDYRLDKMNNMTKELEKNKEDLAKTISIEMGKPINESKGEIDKSIKHINYYIKNAREFLRPRQINFDSFENIVDYEPLGPILNITPWNYPLWVPFKSVIPCLVAGNTIIQKPGARVPETSLKIEKMFKDSGFGYSFQVSFLPHEDIEHKLFSDFRIRSVMFTGSTRIGRIVGELSGKYLKKSLLELGGSDPLIILEDADIDKAAEFAAEGRLRNTGQACICAKRIIIQEKIYDKFIEKIKNEIKKYPMGDPLDPKNKLGPLARLDLFLNLKRQVIESLTTQSANIVDNHITLDEIDQHYTLEQGNFFTPVLLENIKKNSVARCEELFGPVFSFYKVKTVEEAIDLANETEYGLGASVFTKDEELATNIAKKIDSGMVFINSSTFSDSRLPYGGVKNSGYGRTSADAAIYEFTNNKNISKRK